MREEATLQALRDATEDARRQTEQMSQLLREQEFDLESIGNQLIEQN